MIIFNNPYTRIRTLEGDKFISHIKVGDTVLNHKNLYSRVTSTMKESVEKHRGSVRLANIYYEKEEDGIKIIETLFHTSYITLLSKLRKERTNVRVATFELEENDLIAIRKDKDATFGRVISIDFMDIKNKSDFSPYLYGIELDSHPSMGCYCDDVLCW